MRTSRHFAFDTMKNDQLLAQLIEPIPPFPAIANKVLQLARQSPVDFKQLAQLISTDPALSALVIRMANSPLYGSIRSRVENIDRAIVVLGQNHIIDSAVLYITRNLRQVSKTSWKQWENEFWRHSIGVAVAARMLAKQMNVSHAKQSFLAGLMHDIGKIALMAYDPDAYQETIQTAKATNRPLYYVELESFGTTHSMVGREICKHWHLPITTTKAVAYHHDDPDTITLTVSNLVRSGDLFTKIAGIGDGGNPFGMNDKKLLLPHPQFTQQDIFDFLRNLTRSVDDLVAMVFDGQKKTNKNQTLGLLSNPNVIIHVMTGNEPERLMLRYVLHELGYKQSDRDNQVYDAETQMVVKIMDYQPQFTQPNEHVVDFGAWRNGQPQTPQQEINIKLLQRWLKETLSGLLTRESAMVR